MRVFLAPLVVVAACTPSTRAPTELADAFAEAAETYEVPVEVLVATSYAVSRFDQRFGEENREGGVGVMNLRVGDTFPSMPLAATRLGMSEDALADSASANILGAAALLHTEALELQKLTGEPVDTLEEWYPLVAAWSGSEDPLVADGFAAQVYDWIQWGLAGEAPTGELVELHPTALPWRESRMAVSGSGLVYQYIPACSSNFSDYNRGSGDIDYVIIHTMEGTYSGSISWFQNCSAQVSAHYNIRSSDGQITQMVQEEDVAWHAGYWDYNKRGIGIEHEGYVSQPSTWYTDAMYRASAALTRDLCDRYGIPKDRAHVIGHNEVPGCSSGGGGSGCHTDPGSGWNWDYYMSLVTESGSGSESLGGSGVADGPRTGTFDAKVKSTRYGDTDTCSGSLTGAVNGGQVYLNGKCTLVGHADKVKDLPVTWTGTVTGTTLSGRMVVDGHDASFTGAVNADGSLQASFSGSEDLGGDVGAIEFEVNLAAAP
ncbi:MAG: N-acetylmuramoyl-L-alanine amidase [Pseudomonadota bacterium]|nr:N-acetylmuramoyl-L-alanine amidase [Pseudomonadota bacterium]